MSKILELRSRRNTLWEQTKAFLEQHRGENGLVAADAVEQYNKMAQEVKDLGAEIEAWSSRRKSTQGCPHRPLPRCTAPRGTGTRRGNLPARLQRRNTRLLSGT